MNTYPTGLYITDLRASPSHYCPYSQFKITAKSAVPPPLFTSDDLVVIFGLPKNPKYEDQYALVLTREVPSNHYVLYLFNKDPSEQALQRLGYLQEQTGCCGATLIACLGTVYCKNSFTDLRQALEVASLVSKAILGRSFLSAITTQYQTAFKDALLSMGYVSGLPAASKSTGNILSVYTAPAALNWHHIPTSVLDKAGVS